MKFSISYPTNGTTKSIQVDDDNKCRVFFDKRMGQEVEADSLGQEYKGYVFKINGGFDKDGFAMKQGVFCNNRIRLLLSPGTQGYRAKRTGQRKRKSVRGCIVGSDIKMLSVTLVKKGEKEIPGLTDTVRSRRMGPKRASGIRKLYGIEKTEGEKTLQSSVALIKKHAIRRTFKSKKSADKNRHKAPKIQRLVTEARLRRKRIQKTLKINNSKRSAVLAEQYKKVYDVWASKNRAAAHDVKVQRKASKEQPKAVATKPAQVKKPVVAAKPAAKPADKPAAKVADKPAAKTTTPVVKAPAATTAKPADKPQQKK